jgi:signal peptidase
VRRWRGSDSADEPWDDEVDDGRPKARRGKPLVFWRARDSLYFEPLVALAILALLLVSLFAYTSNWPPVYVVESNSMQHGPGDHLGYINAGDIVLAQKASAGSITTYVDAESTGLSTYGELGDVILYQPNGASGATPVVHRAILYLEYSGVNSTYSAIGLPANGCGAGSSQSYKTTGTPTGCGTSGLSGGDTLYLYGVGGRTVTVDFGCSSVLGQHSGFLTLGDNNSAPDQNTQSCVPTISTLVEPAWVIGVARGLIPWFGDIKLLLDGNAGYVSGASWEFLGLTIAAVIFVGVGLHLLFRRRREERGAPRRRKDALDEDRAEPLAPPPRGRPSVRPWRAAADPGVDDDAPPRRRSYAERRRAHFASSRESRTERRRAKPSHESEDDRS